MEQLGVGGIVWGIVLAFWPCWLGLGVVFALSIAFHRRLGLYGRLFDSSMGAAGLALVLFWVLAAIFHDVIAPYGALEQLVQMRNAWPGEVPPGGAPAFLLGGDHIGRDVFSRMVHGSTVVLSIAPAATVFAFMVGITLGLPAGYFGQSTDTILSFLANLVLAFPVILLFYLLVTPGMRETEIPTILAAVLFIFPVVFLTLFFWSRFREQPLVLVPCLAVTLALGLWAYSGLAFNADPLGVWSMSPNLLNVFVAVVFVNSPTVFRIVRGLSLDIKSRDYVSAAQTRGEGPWYIMLWEVLPNVRGPLIVDFCLRLGYTTILLGTLGFFGLGVTAESPDWGMTINQGRRLLTLYPHPALAPAIALISLVLGLNLLADGLREQSLRD